MKGEINNCLLFYFMDSVVLLFGQFVQIVVKHFANFLLFVVDDLPFLLLVPQVFVFFLVSVLDDFHLLLFELFAGLVLAEVVG